MLKKYFSKPKSSTPTKRNGGDTVIIFVHGLGGDAEGTWGKMLSLVNVDTRLSQLAYDCYVYPTSLFRLAMRARRPGIRELADGLRTHIATHHSDKSHIYLVGHSLGGLIIRRHILDLIQTPDLQKIAGTLLYAVPNEGSQLANVISAMSWSHQQTLQLKPDSDLLDNLNRDWINALAEQKTEVTYVVGGADQIVKRKSGAWSQHSTVETIIEAGHRDIVKPTSIEDTAYKLLYNILTRRNICDEAVNTTAIVPIHREADPLFDIYIPKAEIYYLERENDKVIAQAILSSHIWIYGDSGVGKTASLKRLAYQSNWRLEHFLLSGHTKTSPTVLMSAIITGLYERFNQPQIIVNASSDLEIQLHLKKIYDGVPRGTTLAILVEEIPTANDEEYKALLKLMYLAIFSAEAHSNATVVWLFSSITDPNPFITSDLRHFRERVQLIQFKIWSEKEISGLFKLIKKYKNIRLSASESKELVGGSCGSPRVLKLVLRQRLNATGPKTSLSEVIRATKTDLGMK